MYLDLVPFSKLSVNNAAVQVTILLYVTEALSDQWRAALLIWRCCGRRPFFVI